MFVIAFWQLHVGFRSSQPWRNHNTASLSHSSFQGWAASSSLSSGTQKGGEFGDGPRFQSWWEIPCQQQVAIKQGSFPRGAGKNTHALVKESKGQILPGWAVQSEVEMFVHTRQCVWLPRGRVSVWSGKTVPCLPRGKAYEWITMTRPQEPEETPL